MNLQERYDDLDNLVRNIDMTIDETTDKYYKEALNLLKYEVQNELDEIEPILLEMQKAEKKELNREYERSVS